MERKVESVLFLFLAVVVVAAAFEVCNRTRAEVCPLYQATSLGAR